VGYLKGKKIGEILILFTWVPQCDNLDSLMREIIKIAEIFKFHSNENIE
jgi:hypothetical protein